MSKHKSHGINVCKFTAIVLLIALSFITNTSIAETNNSKKGLVLQGKTLKALYNGKSRVIKRGDFYGYGWLDDHRVFIAFQQEGWAEAIVNAEVVDLLKSQVIELGTTKGNGESNFAVNSHTREVIFNGFGEGRNPDGSVENAIILMSFEAQRSLYKIKIIKRNIDCINVHWIDDNTIGATLYDGHDTHVKITIQR